MRDPTDFCPRCGEDETTTIPRVLAQREGASTRTADELMAVFIGDVESLRPEIRPYDAAMTDAVDLADDYWDACPDGGWAPMPEDDSYGMGEALADAVSAAESALADLELSVWWDDGYRITRVTGGPLA